MDGTIERLTKLAQDLTDRVDELANENARLSKALEEKSAELTKKAAEQKPSPMVSEQVVDATLDALVKAGALSEDQREESRGIMLADMEAPHRILQRFLDAQGQAKTASKQDIDNVSGGKLADDTRQTKESDSAVLDRMMAILHM